MKKLKERLKSKKTQVTSLAILGILFITAGISYAFFTYSRDGLKENVIESGSIKFHYQEDSQGISITDGMPVDDNTGKSSNKYFDFSVTSTTSSKIKIPYYVTVKRKGNDSSLDNAVKLYLTEVNNNSETELTLDNDKTISTYGELANYVNNDLNITVAKNEKSLYRAIVPVNSNNYEKHYRLRMWLTDGIEFTQTVTGSCSDPTYTTAEACVEAHKDWTDVATTDQKEFTVKVNVYGFGNMASDNANINSLLVDNNELTPVSTNAYETTLPSSVDTTTINVETENDDATVQVIKTQSDYTTPIALNSSNIQRLSAIKTQTVPVIVGDNYFKVTVTSEDSIKTKELHVKITVPFVLSSQIRLDNTLRTETPNFHNIDPFIASYTDNNFDGKEFNINMSTNANTNQSYYYTYADSYTFDTTTGTYTLVNPQVCQYSSCWQTLKGKYIPYPYGISVNFADNSSNLSTIYKVTSATTLGTLYYIYSAKTENYDNSLSGLYKMSVTNGFGGSNGDTYYFRGNITNNYVEFGNMANDLYYGYYDESPTANKKAYSSLSECQNASSYNYNCTKINSAGDSLIWRVVRINEDGTVRLILDSDTLNANGVFNSNYDNYTYMYYSNSQAKTAVETWYNTNITGTNTTKVAIGNYFCEAYKVTSGVDTYTPDLACQTDGNNKGLLNNTVGLINYDEVVIAGGYYDHQNTNYYLYKNLAWWTMSPGGFSNSNDGARTFLVNGGYPMSQPVKYSFRLRPVINLKANVTATGTGTSADPYVVQ